MKGAVTFFLLLCFHLLGGYDAAHAVAPNGNLHLPPARVEKAKPADSANTSHGYLMIIHAAWGEEKEEIASIYDDDDDDADDEDEVIPRKHIATAKCLLAFYRSFLLYHSRSNFAASPSFCKPPPYTASRKYIAQRVLRI